MKMYGRAFEAADRILDAFKSPEALPKALAPIFIHRKDDVPCRRWSWGNQLLTALSGTEDARGYRQWQEAGRHVQKGAHCFHILAPCMRKVERPNSETGEVETVPVVVGFRTVPVFRLEDTEGADIPTGDPEIDNWVANLPLRAVAHSWGVAVSTYNGEGARFAGYYRQTKDGERKGIALGVQNLATFFHELVHAADYKLGTKTEPGQHWRSETVAEFGGALLAQVMGFDYDSDLGGAYEYIERYAETAKKRPVAACLECLDRICKAVALILDTAEELQHSAPAVA